jgi:Ca2+-binding RTX toxin-like protein
VLTVVAVVAALMAIAGPASAQVACTITGTAGNDNLTGTEGDDVICGLQGRDSLTGLGGNDRLEGGQGKDTLAGGRGNDILDGGDGTDDRAAFYDSGNTSQTVDLANLTASSPVLGTDTFVAIGGSGSPANIEDIDGSAGNDNLTGNQLSNFIDGRTGNDVIHGHEASDNLVGNAGDDQLFGEAGNDRLLPGEGTDTASGGPNGAFGDQIRYTDIGGGVTINLGAGTASGPTAGSDTFSGIENAWGSTGDDTIIGQNGVANRVNGVGGTDSINTQDGVGNDEVDGGPGSDTCTTDGGDTVVNCP